MAILAGFAQRVRPVLRHPDFLSLLFLFILPLFFLWPVLFGGKVLLPLDSLYSSPPWSAFAASQGVGTPHNQLIGDMILQNYSWKNFATESYQSGQFPLWNPHIFGGMPFLAAGQNAALYPLGVIFYLMPVAAAYGWFTALHLFLAGAFTFLFARILGSARVASLISAVAFMFSAFLVVSFVWPMMVSATVWLPLILAMVELTVRETERDSTGDKGRVSPVLLWVVLGGLAVGLQMLAGHLEITFYVLFSAMVFAAFRLGQLLLQEGQTGRLGRTLRTGLFLWVMMGIGFGLAAAQLAPFFELIRENFRAGYTTLDEVMGWALPIKRLMTFLVPDFFGNPARHSYFDLLDWSVKDIAVPGIGGSVRSFVEFAPGLYKNYVEGASYVGLLPLLLAPFALFWRRHRHVWFFAGYSAISLLLAFGTPLYRVFWVIPGFNQLHTPFRWILPYSFCLSILAGLGLNTLLSQGVTGGLPARIWRWSGGLAALAGLGVLLVLGTSFVLRERSLGLMERVVERSKVVGEAFGSARLLYSFESQNLVIFGVILLAAGFCFLGMVRIKKPWFAYSFVLLLITDLFIAGQGFNTAADQRLLDFVPPSMAKLREDPDLYRVVSFNNDDMLKPNAGMLFGLQDVRGYDTIIPKQYVSFWRLLEEPQGLTFSMIHKLVQAKSLESPLLDLLNVKYILTTQNIGLPHYSEVYRGEVNIYRNDDVLPRAFVVFEEQRAESEAAALAALSASDFDPRSNVIIESAGDLPPLPAGNTGTADVQVSKYSPNEVQVEAQLTTEGYLVLSDSFFPGWQASIKTADGDKQIPILRADRIFRAVRLPAGLSEVTFRYKPQSFYLGLYASFLTTVGVLLALAFWLWRRFYREMESGSAVRRIVKNSAAPMAAQLLTKAVDFGFAIFYIQQLGPTGLGEYTVAIVVWSYFSTITGFGLGQLVMRDVGRDRQRAGSYLGNTVTLRLLLTLASFPVIFGIVGAYTRFDAGFTRDAGIAIILFGLSLLPSNVSESLAAICYAYERVEYPAAIMVVTTLLKVTFGVVVLLAGWGVIGLAAVSIFVNVLTVLILWQVVRETFFRPQFAFDLSVMRRMLSDSFPLMINNLLANIFFRIDVLLLQPMKGALEVGYYGTAYKFIDGLNIIPSNFTMAIFPVISRIAHSEKDALSRAFRLSLKALLMVSLPLAVGIGLLSEQIIGRFAGAEFMPQSAIALSVLIGFLPFSFVNSVTQYVLIAVDKQRFLTVAFLIGVVFNVGANFLLIPRFGYVGAAWTTVLSEVVLLVPFFYVARKYVGVMELAGLTVRPLAAALGMGVVVYMLRDHSVLVIVPLGVAVYCLLLVALRTFEKEEIALIGALRRA